MEENVKTLVEQTTIEQYIFLVRGQRVMLSSHLAELYGVETRALVQAVKRNIERFPEDFMLSLTRKEILRISQFVTSLKYSKSVYAFTEQGVAMLSGVLNSPRAVQANIAIMRAFVRIKKFLTADKELARKLDELEKRISQHDAYILEIFKAIRQLMEPPPEPLEEPLKRRIGFHPNS